MVDSYIFSGLGHSIAKYKISNKEIEQAAKDGYLDGFSEERIMASRNYQQFRLKHPNISPFEYFVEHKMGFRTRNYVVPFPPRKKRKWDTETSLELGVKAIDKALRDANIHPEEIGAWIVSTVSPHEQAPGIAATIKSYFVGYDNDTTTITLSSGCSGFNVNLQRALEFMECNPEVDHVVVSHTETMSSFLTDITPFVPFVTFGDAATAVILSRSKTEKKEGLLSVVNYQDPKMIDFVGVSKEWNLYIDNSVVKDRATINLMNASKEVMDESNWTKDDVDMLVPHQTGDAILKPVSKALGIPHEKLYQEVQLQFGNVSGLTVPMGLSLLKEQGMMRPGIKILSATAGVGGEYGSFTYETPTEVNIEIKQPYHYRDLENKTVLLTGGTGGMGVYIARQLAEKGCNILLQYNSNTEKAETLKAELEQKDIKVELLKSDFSNPASVTELVNAVKANYKHIDYIVHAAGHPGSLQRASDVSHDELVRMTQINQLAPIEITKGLMNVLNGTVIWFGSVAEEAQFAGSSAYVSAKRGLHGFAASFAGEAFKNNIRSIYYMPGLVDTGMTDLLDMKQKIGAMNQIKQAALIEPEKAAERIVRLLYLPKVLFLREKYEGLLLVRKDGFFVEETKVGI